MQRHKTLIGVALAAVLALVVVFTVVLPAKRGASDAEAPAQTAMEGKTDAAEPALDDVIEDILGDNDNLQPAAGADPDAPMPLPNPAISQIESSPPKTETMTIKLGFDERTEVKVLLGKSKAIVYNWTVEGDGKVYVDFHGHDPAKSKEFWVRYEEADGISGRSGSLVAPFAGEHGWFWLNVSEDPITIKLTVTGYQEKLVDHGLLK